MKYIKSFADTSAMNEFIENTTENGYYLLRDESKIGQERINYVRINNRTEFCFVAVENSTISFSRGDRNLQYSVNDGDTWIDYDTANTSVNLTTGQKMYWRRTVNTIIGDSLGAFSISGSVDTKGDTYSILTTDYESLTDLSQWGAADSGSSLFKNTFQGDIRNYNATFKATVVKQYTYNRMFESCNIVNANFVFPIENIPNYCFLKTFSGCSHLVKAPDILSTTLLSGWRVIEAMFNACSSLTSVKCLVTDTSAFSNSYWMRSVSRTGTFYKRRGIEWPTGEDGIPSGWTVVEVDE